MFVSGSSAFSRLENEDASSVTMRGKNVLITGSTSGIGLHAAKRFYSLGASIIVTYRNVDRGKKAVEAILESKQAIEGQSVMMLELDLCSQLSVDHFCAETKNALRVLDCLICNAGVMGLPFELTSDGVETHFAANQLGHFSLVRQLFPLLEKAPQGGRIIIVSSGYYTHAKELLRRKEIMGESMWDYTPTLAYSNSKLANCLFAQALSKRLEESASQVRVFCVRPGFVKGTELGRQTPWILRTIASPLIWALASNLDQGISGVMHCATTSIEQLKNGGLYYGNQLEAYSNLVTDDNVSKMWRICERIEGLIAERSHGKIAPRQFDWPRPETTNDEKSD